MQLLGKLEIKSKEKIIEFLSSQQTGRISSIDENGYPQIIPMNFVYISDVIYMHSHVRGEKLDNIRRNQKVGFEVDKNLEFLPSYFSDPTDASLADTLYISVVIKGNASIVSDKEEKTTALNGLMKKYQPEGGYEPIKPEMDVLDEVVVIKIVPKSLRGTSWPPGWPQEGAKSGPPLTSPWRAVTRREIVPSPRADPDETNRTNRTKRPDQRDF